MNTKTFLKTTTLSLVLALGMISSASAISPNDHDVVQDARGQVVRSTNGTCVRTKWMAEGDDCSGNRQVQLTSNNQNADEDRTVYFEFNKIDLMSSERRKLDSLTTELKSMNGISGVNIVGYADRIGSVDYNKRLSEQRAKVVESYLHQHGYLNTNVAKTRWLGESDPKTSCGDNLKRTELINCLQRDRQVTVEIQYNSNKTTRTIDY